MLITQLDSVKQSLVYQRLYLAAQHEASGLFQRFLYSYKLHKIALAETKIVWLQQSLSFLNSQISSILIEWDDISDHEKSDWQSSIRVLISEINLSNEIIDAIDGIEDIKTLDPFYFKNTNQTAEILASLSVNKSCLENYVGNKISKDPLDVSAVDLLSMISTVKATNVCDTNSLNEAVQIIGKWEAFDFRMAIGTRFSKGRLN